MVFTERDTELYRRDVKAKGHELSAEERARLLEPYLSTVPTAELLARTSPQAKHPLHTPRVRPFLRTSLQAFTYFIIQLLFGFYLRLRQIYHALFDRFLAILYYHHRTPELIQKDVKTLSRLPHHLSVILTLNQEQDGGLERLLDEVAELSAWCACAGIPLLSVYEKTGVLKSYMSSIHKIVHQKLASYFGPPPVTPNLRVVAPNHPSMSASREPQDGHVNGMTNGNYILRPDRSLDLLLLSASDGRDTLVDLTRTLTEMSQYHKLSPKDITSELINAEISATTTIPPQSSSTNGDIDDHLTLSAPTEPDLLIIFGPQVKLQGYPPWQVRLTEIFCVGDSSADVVGNGANTGARVEYQAFLRGLWKFAGAQVRFGR